MTKGVGLMFVAHPHKKGEQTQGKYWEAKYKIWELNKNMYHETSSFV